MKHESIWRILRGFVSQLLFTLSERQRQERELDEEIKERAKKLKQKERELAKERNRLKWEETQKKKMLAEGADMLDEKSFLASEQVMFSYIIRAM